MKKNSPNVLLLDIETAPSQVYRFDDYSMPSTMPLEFEIAPPRILCFAARKYGESKTLYRGENIMSHEDMIISAWEMINESDIIVTYNGNRFDLPWMNTEFHLLGLPKPSPYKSLDIYQMMKQFKLPSKRLAYVSKKFGWGQTTCGKLASGGPGTWVSLLAGDQKIWKQFQKYNVQDVDVLVDAFESMKSWFPTWFNLNVYSGGEGCPKCGDDESLQRRGLRHTSTGSYQRYACMNCGAWSSSGKRLEGVDIR